MFTVEIRINGTMVVHAYGRNTDKRDQDGKTIYDIEFYQPERPQLCKFPVLHDKNDGINKLVEAVLREAEYRFSIGT